MRPAKAPDESPSRGNSFVKIISRVGSVPVNGSRFLRSMVRQSSPLMLNSRSTTICESVRPPNRASETMARDFPIRGHSPKFVDRLARVGPQTFSLPIVARNTRLIVPLPDRRGPMTRESSVAECRE